MPQKYIFEVTIEDSGDEFSEQFNVNDPRQITHFETSLQEIMEENNWYSTFTLKRVIVDL